MMRYAAAALVCIGIVSLRPHPAAASFHLMRIVEIFPGTAEQPDAQYVMLQMYAAGQNFVGGLKIDVFDADGTSAESFTFPNSVPNGANQATILIGTAQAATLFGVMPDLEMNPVIVPAGGKVCYSSLDCVSWGTFSGNGAAPSPSGTPFNAGGGLTLGMAIRRDFGKDGDPATLGAGDDSNDSAADFLLAAPMPKNNQGQTGMPTPTATPTGTPTPSATRGPCGGYCDGTGEAAPDELLTLVGIALGAIPLSSCQPGDSNTDETLSVDEIVAAVDHAVDACTVVVFPPPPSSVRGDAHRGGDVEGLGPRSPLPLPKFAGL